MNRKIPAVALLGAIPTPLSDWKVGLLKKAKRISNSKRPSEDRTLIQAVELLTKNKPPLSPPRLLAGQPFDSHLLSLSSIFARSRSLFHKSGGTFEASLITSRRTLGSANLLLSKIEYSPIENEMIWAATDPIQKQDPSYLKTLRTHSTSLFHEQNHRILWKLIPPAPPGNNAVRRYLNFIESLVITADMAIGDELTPPLAQIFYLLGVTYDPGTKMRSLIHAGRDYRNYLQATTYATYLFLEMYKKQDILNIVENLYSNLGEFSTLAFERSARLDRQFIQKTNPIWQERHWKTVISSLHKEGVEPLLLSEDPLDNRLQYLWIEKWLDVLRL